MPRALCIKLLQTTALVGAALLMSASFASAETMSAAPTSFHVLQQALATDDHLNIYAGGADKNGFNIAGGFFSGRASGINPVATNYVNGDGDRTAELEADQRVYALIIDSSYDFNRNQAPLEGFHPYLEGGVGMAMYDHSPAASPSALASSGDMVPLARVGGGMNYHISPQLNLSMDYKAGISGLGSDGAFISHTQQAVDTHIVNIGMNYKF